MAGVTALADDFGGVDFTPRGIARAIVSSDGTPPRRMTTWNYAPNRIIATLDALPTTLADTQAALHVEALEPTVLASSFYNKAAIDAAIGQSTTDTFGTAEAFTGLAYSIAGVNSDGIWGMLLITDVVSGADTHSDALELDVDNNGTDVSSTGSSLQKIGILEACDGTVPCTTAFSILGVGGEGFHHGILVTTSTFTAATDNVLEDVNEFTIQNNGNFATIGGMALGSLTPYSSGLSVTGPGTTGVTPLIIQNTWGGVNSTDLMASIDSYADVDRVALRRANGTAGSPTAIASADFLGNLNFRGYYVTGGPGFSAGVAAVAAQALENFTSTNQGTKLTFTTTAIGSASGVVHWTMGGNGGLYADTVSGLDEGTATVNATSYYAGGVLQGTTWSGGATALATSALTEFFPANGITTINGTEANVENAVAAPQTYTKLYCVNSTAEGAAKSDAYTLRKNAVDCGLACTITNATSCNDTAHTCTVAVGDTVDIKDVTTGSAITAREGSCAIAP